MSFLYLLTFLVGLSTVQGRRRRRRRNTEYDYVVVGAGSAGSIVAAELATRLPHADVLLIEEGYFSGMNQIIDELGRVAETRGLDSVDADYSTGMEPNLFNRVLPIDRAKITGGCNAHNANVYFFANENDFDRRWGNIDGWTLDDLIPIFERVESKTFSGLKIDDSNIWIQRFLQSAQDNGYPLNPDVNDLSGNGTQEGATPTIFQGNQLNDSYIQRGMSYTSYIDPIIESQDNLDIIIASRVDKILFEEKRRGRGRRRRKVQSVYGIEVFNRGTFRTETIYINKELIVSTGVFDTPKLLMLSGIGDCNMLENDYNIECLVDLPEVGRNLQDHFLVFIVGPPFINQTASINELPNDFNSFPGGNWGVNTFSSLGRIQNSIGIASLEALGIPGVSIGASALLNDLTSLGNVTLTDTDPSSRPSIIHNFLDTPEDNQLVIEGFRRARALLYNTTVFDGLILDQSFELVPGSSIPTNNDFAILAYAKNAGQNGYHATGTAAINKVVDNTLKVMGFENLRIADASVAPTPVSANINAITMVIGQKAADLIVDEAQGN